MKSILLNAANDPGWFDRYQVALELARCFSGRLRCVQATPFFDTGEGFFAFYPYPEIAGELHEIGRQHRARTEDQLRADGCAWSWHEEALEDQTQALIRWSRLSDVTVISTGASTDDKPRRDDLAMAGAVTVHARGPILAVPPGLGQFDPLGTALIAWNGSPEAAGALRAALPLLRRAKAAHLVSVGEQAPPASFTAEDATSYLERHDVACAVHPWTRQDQSVAAALLDAAAALGADYIVAGAYGHTRLREAVLGGTTRQLLRSSTIPLLLTH
jgi:nucleotide-binding universal stress UspA family protein